MSGIATAVVAAAVIGAGTAIYTTDVNRKKQNEAQDQAKAQALRQEKLNEEAQNQASQRKADPLSILQAAQQAAKGGVGSTMLTGSAGVSPDLLKLGKTSLLGA